MASPQAQVVLVTGCSSGIGRALAHELHARGHRVFASARRLESIAGLEQAGIATVALDVTQRRSIEAAIEKILAETGRIDVLVNNAGVNAYGPLLEQPLDQLRDVFEANVLGMVAVTQAVFPHMAERGQGRIVNVGSVVGLLPTPFAAAYCASKSAVHMLSEVMRVEVAPFGIDVVVVQPGGVQSDIAINGSHGIERYNQPTSRYQAAYAGICKRANASQDNAMPTEDFAREVVALALETSPPRVIRRGTGSDTLPQLAELPAVDRDALMTRLYGLENLGSRRNAHG